MPLAALKDFLPAIAQGALGIEYPARAQMWQHLLAPFTQPDTTRIVTAERAFGRTLMASCDVPLARWRTWTMERWY